MRPLTPGFRFKEGRLLIFTELQAIALDPWPKLQAERRSAAGGGWELFIPAFRLLRPRALDMAAAQGGGGAARVLGPGEFVSQALDPELERRRAFDTFRHALPPEVALAAERFSNRQWRVLQLAQANPQSLDLFRQNPALAFCLASQDVLKGMVAAAPVSQAARMAGCKQREILRWLQFPNTEACVKLFGKIPPEVISIAIARRLCSALKTEAVPELLAHLPRLNAALLALVCDPRHFGSISPKLLAEVAALPDEAEQAAVAPLLHDLQLMGEVLAPEEPPKVFQSLAKLRRTHQEVSIRYCAREVQAVLNCQFPPPPLPGTKEIVALTSPQALAEEGRRQHNCVATYAKWVANGGGYIYQVLRPERATLEITKGPDGQWHISQLRLAGNERPSETTRRNVLRWLRQYSVSV